MRTFWGGTARYRTERGTYAVDPGSWFVVNRGQPYEITLDSPGVVESLVVFLPEGWAEDVARSLACSQRALLDQPDAAVETVSFFETVTEADDVVMPRLSALRDACARGDAADNWLEEKLRELVHALLWHESGHRRRADRLGAVRWSTRRELYRRLARGRDFLRAEAEHAPGLSDAARVAGLSPYHFQRTFTAVFGESPHRFSCRCRLERARRRLERADQSALEIAALAGYESYGAFHRAFRRAFGLAPSQVRKISEEIDAPA